MKVDVLSLICLLLLLFFICSLSEIQGVNSETQSQDEAEHASLPPRGWNSYDAFSWIINEEQFLQNAEIVSRQMKSHGYEYVVVDFLWYRKQVEGAYTDSLGFDVIDEWGRMQPDPGRWPSSAGGKGFTEVAAKVHSMGLKFGIHVMRGVSSQAVNSNTPILNVETGKAYEDDERQWHASDIGIKERACAWMKNGFMSVDTKTVAGRAFLKSLYRQYADWGVDIVKHDCVFGTDLDLDEITTVSEVLKELDRPIIYSLSPGVGVTPALAKEVSGLVNMYRITGDDWDNWNDVASHFNVARDLAEARLIGANGLKGKSWPDLDMLPFGWLTYPGANKGPHRQCNLTVTEQKTQMTLWSMAKSPLMYGGDLRRISVHTLALITNPTLLEINWFSSNNKQFPYITHSQCSQLRRRVLSHHPRNEKCTRNLEASEARVLSLRSCKDERAKGWSHELLEDDLERICWNGNTTKHHKPFCLKRRASHEGNQELRDSKRAINGKLHLLETENRDSCLTAAPNRKINSAEASNGLFSNCKVETYQMWELKRNGTLKNDYSGLCASLDLVKDNVPQGSRSWIASGRRGEIYVAFFNLDKETSVVSTTASDIAKAFPDKNLSDPKCSGRELWSGKSFKPVKVLSITLSSHGSALFVLNCS